MFSRFTLAEALSGCGLRLAGCRRGFAITHRTDQSHRPLQRIVGSAVQGFLAGLMAMKTLLELLTYFLGVCSALTWAVGFYYYWMYRRCRRSDRRSPRFDRRSDPRPGDPALSDESRAYGNKGLIALLLLGALIGLQALTDHALRSIAVPGG
jgi:hypothetical protein